MKELGTAAFTAPRRPSVFEGLQKVYVMRPGNSFCETKRVQIWLFDERSVSTLIRTAIYDLQVISIRKICYLPFGKGNVTGQTGRVQRVLQIFQHIPLLCVSKDSVLTAGHYVWNNNSPVRTIHFMAIIMVYVCRLLTLAQWFTFAKLVRQRQNTANKQTDNNDTTTVVK